MKALLVYDISALFDLLILEVFIIYKGVPLSSTESVHESCVSVESGECTEDDEEDGEVDIILLTKERSNLLFYKPENIAECALLHVDHKQEVIGYRCC